MILAIDFDGTCVEHEFPHVGPDVPGAADTLHLLAALGHRLLLWTMRSGDSLDEAVAWFEERGIPLAGVNENPQQRTWTASPKAYAHRYIDDAALGCPLVYPAALAWEAAPRPYVDWPAVARLLGVGEAL